MIKLEMIWCKQRQKNFFAKISKLQKEEKNRKKHFLPIFDRKRINFPIKRELNDLVVVNKTFLEKIDVLYIFITIDSDFYHIFFLHDLNRKTNIQRIFCGKNVFFFLRSDSIALFNGKEMFQMHASIHLKIECFHVFLLV